LLLIDGILSANLVFNPSSKNGYLAAIIDKMHLLDSVPSPRLILMSGSSMAFGVDSDLLSKELEIPVVNASLDSKLGSRFMVDELKAIIKKGDIVLITLEYIATSEGENEEKLLAADFYPPAKDWIHFTSFLEEMGAYVDHSLTNFKVLIEETWSETRQKPIDINDTTSVYFRKCFTKNGDLIAHLNNPQSKFEVPKIPANLEFSKQIQDLNNFEAFAKQKGVRVFFTFPSYSESGYEKNMNVIKIIEKQFRDNLKLTVLGSPENSVMDNKFFYDSVFHPNAQGRKIFSSRLTQLLEQEEI